MQFTRVLTADKPDDVDVASWIRWKTVDAVVTASDGGVIFEQRGVEVPEQWSQNAANILAQKYLRKAGVPLYTSHISGPGDDHIPMWLWRSGKATGSDVGGETSARQVFHRMAGCWTYWGWREGLFRAPTSKKWRDVGVPLANNEQAEENARIFYDEVFASLALQYAAPNSPQWFNTGLHWAYGIEGPDSGQWIPGNDGSTYRVHNSYEYPQPHACFIQTVDDDLVNPGGMMDLWTREARLFKHGSGSGSNMSKVRGKGERLSGGGVSSGLMSFLRVGDRSAGSIKSGGTTRRAALMRVLDADHPEIEDFIDWKSTEEHKAACIAVGSGVIHDRLQDITMARRVPRGLEERAESIALGCGVPQSLVDRTKAGETDWPVYSADSFEGPAIETVSGQNSNNSVRISNRFLGIVDGAQLSSFGLPGQWVLTERTSGNVAKVVTAKDLWRRLCRAAWASGDPGVQFDDTINEWHTCAVDGRINASNPCCFVGETYVDTSESFISIAELTRMSAAGEDLPWAFCFDRETSLPDLRPIRRAWCSGYAHRLTEVTTRNGQTLRCTPEHGWLTRRADGYVAAKDLRVGTSLQKINREVNTSRSDRVALTHRSVGERHGRTSQHKFIWEKIRGPVPSGYDVHHRNDDPTDDRYSNFAIVENGRHQSEHSRGVGNPRFLSVDDKTLVDVYDAASRHRRATHRTRTGISVSLWNKYVRQMGLVGIVPMANPTGGGRIQGDSWDNFIVRMERARASVNDSVLSVKTIELDEAVPVYDVEVEGCHNFGVRSDAARNGDSIIVHNSEYLFLDDTACNLASIRLTKFLPLDDDDLARFEHVVRLWTVVLEISVYMASFPSEAIARNTYLYRTLGLGYADLGGLLMRLAIPYASDEGRALAAGLTALMTGAAYRTSAEMAEEIGPFPRWDANEQCMRRVLRNHARATGNWVGGEGYEDLTIEPRRELINLCSYDLLNRIRRAWSIVMSAELFRNAQVTVMAPTGTISFVMDCDTTGVEPDFALVKHKQLAGGGSMRIVNQAVPEALGRLGYQGDVIEKILRLVDETGRPDHYLDGQHLGIFACAGDISPEDHVRMVAAVQPLLSGGASKTINMPRDATVDDVDQMLRLAASLGVKSIAVYRDGSKLSQPLSASYDKSADLLSNREAVFRSISPHPISNPGDGGELWQPRAIDQSKGPADTRPVVSERLADDMKRFGMSTDNVVVAPSQLPVSLARGEREYLPWRRDRGFTQKIKIGENRQSVFLRVSEYPDGRPGEVFLEIAGEGSTLRALANCLAISISVGLQRGVPVAEYVDQFVGTKFEPAGYVEGHDRIRFASSIVDYIGRELGIAYDGRDDLANSPAPIAETIERIADASERADEEWRSVIDPRLVAHVRVPSWQPTGDACPMCGSLLRRAGTCRSCPNCEYDEGCSG